MLELYENIKKQRLRLGLSQDELAKKVGYKDRSMVAKIEKGLVDLSRGKIYQFAEALETTPQDLFGYEETDLALEPDLTEAVGILTADDELSRSVVKLTKLNKKDQQMIGSMIDFFYSEEFSNN